MFLFVYLTFTVPALARMAALAHLKVDWRSACTQYADDNTMMMMMMVVVVRE